MSGEPCAGFATRLIEYADGELPPADAETIRQHLEACPHCRSTLAALNQSLALAREIWADAEGELTAREEGLPAEQPHVGRPCVQEGERDARPPMAGGKPGGRASRPPGKRARWAVPIAAALLLVIGIPAVRHGLRPSRQELTPAEIENLTARAGVSAQMLAAAEYLAENGGEELARQRLEYLVTAYPETDAAAIALTRLKTERRMQ